MDRLVDADRHNAVLFVILDLFGAAAVRLIHRELHRVGDTIGIHNHTSARMTRGAANRLDQSSTRTQESLFIRIQDRYQRYFRQVKPFTQKIDSNKYIEYTQTQIPQD